MDASAITSACKSMLLFPPTRRRVDLKVAARTAQSRYNQDACGHSARPTDSQQTTETVDKIIPYQDTQERKSTHSHIDV